MSDPLIEEMVSSALSEDIGSGDVTTEALVPPGMRARARIDRKQPGMVYGLEVAQAVFRHLDPDVRWDAVEAEAEWRNEAPGTIVHLEGDGRALLTGERVALNFLSHLSGVATLTASCVDAVRDLDVTILDTRKTLPGLRVLEKRAVQAGGGRNHRMGLHDAILVKDNHIALAGGIREATERALARRPRGVPVEVECGSLEDVEEALEAGADRLLLDNMDTVDLRRAVEASAGRATLEASGSMTPERLREVASTGVQFISVGALTHSAPALDLSMTTEPA
jgi:nicotinate-nucleotide pyrophosphorylase (carboxylating)